MGATAARWLVGGMLAATASLVVTVPPTLVSDPARSAAYAAVRAEPSGDTSVTFEVVPASPTVTPPTPTRHPPTPTPSHGGQLPVTGPGGPVLLLAALGMTLLALGWLAARRRRPS
ncbi:LPXTG cell wall anchor domain-containing protein [Micromonospora sp. NPDC093244]|uniref:LPXTG cell wall anchor domain-containing protein n=1 Tax=Micromonospora sp. NPDC093244 TaxID=3155071 RepID=UPI003439D504